jgi:hypothetical protein
MKLEEAYAILERADADEWQYVDGLTDGGFQQSVWADATLIQVEWHPSRAIYKPAMGLSLAWGYPDQEQFSESWAEGFPDSNARSHFLDLQWNGIVVKRWQRVSVDGGRCGLPVPRIDLDRSDPSQPKITAHWISGYTASLFELVETLERGNTAQFYDYLSRAGIEVR